MCKKSSTFAAVLRLELLNDPAKHSKQML